MFAAPIVVAGCGMQAYCSPEGVGAVQSLAQQMLARANELAASGKHRDWREIADTLVLEGFTSAPTILDNPLTRANLDRTCAAHWKNGKA